MRPAAWIAAAGLLVLPGTGGQEPPSRTWSFPADHAAHPAFSSEWWYLTGHLQQEGGGRLAVQTVFFRQALPPVPGAPEGWTPPVLYPAHMGITDSEEGTFTVREVLGRELGGTAGAREDTLDVWSRGWRLRALPEGGWHLSAGSTPGPILELELEPSEEPLLHGRRGYSVKDPGAERPAASWYYSIPRVAARGSLVTDGRRRRVEGVLWFDHEFFDPRLLTDLEGWDWFGLRLEDGGSLMVSRVRSGGRDHLWGTWRDAGGRSTVLDGEAIRLEPLAHWTSPDGAARYPVRWRLEVLPAGLDAVVAAEMPASELRTERPGRVRYWEGSVVVRQRTGAGAGSGRRLGEGFLEMTGYAGAILPGGGRPPGRDR